MQTPDEPPLPGDFDALLELVAHDADAARARRAFVAAAKVCGLSAAMPRYDDLVRFDQLEPLQARLARALAWEPFVGGGFGIPASRRLLRRWLGVDPPGVLEREMTITRDGVEVTLPLWQLWRGAPVAELEHNQGIPDFMAEALAPAELIEAAAESVLEPYGIRGFPLEARLRKTLDEHGAEAADWAEGFADLLVTLRSPDSPRSRDDARGYGMLGIYDWDTLGQLVLVPIVKAGRALAPRWDVLVPFAGSKLFVRTVLAALPPERAEAIVYHRLMTDWGSGGEKALNGFTSGLVVLDLVPSVRVTQILSAKLKNNRSHFKRQMPTIKARLDALAAEHPGVAEGLKPRRAKKPAAP